ncbi:helix-turn-helix transcriptional regulator [Ruania halotolerans]|uniref:helix-turn-helix transcriptional regulator n=1 Tax=Ruania halotolerans TaxID=2897773 RepID=UPI001E4E01E8|nr:YafY family protein [Ruania halotolerans]UFU08258.1 YafY family transcriptional regulator [Ruania halotolerans]
MEVASAEERGTTERVLSLLGLLQQRQVWTGPELAKRLSVTTRTVRRDVERLRELGYRVEAAQGVGGGYRLQPGQELPPLMLDDAEAIAIAVSLLAGAGAGVTGTDDSALGALTKLDRVLPTRLRQEVQALSRAVESFTGGRSPVDPAVLMVLARACRDHVEVAFEYPPRAGASDSARATRRVEPYRLVTSDRRWYLFAYDLDRSDWRTFRVDRMTDVAARTWRFTPREAPDAAAYVQDGVTSRVYRRQARFLVEAPAETVRRQIPASAAVVIERPGERCEVRAGSDDLDFVLLHVALLGHEFTVLEPPDLGDRAADVAARLGRASGGVRPPGS